MSWMKGVRARLRSLLRRGSEKARMEEEFALHVELTTEAHIRAGHSPVEARRLALRDFGGVDRHREEMWDGRGLRWLEDAFHDVRFAGRSLRRTPGFVAAAVLTIALGVGATTALYSLTLSLLSRPLPVPSPDRLVSVQEQRTGMVSTGPEGVAIPYARYEAYVEATGELFTGLAAHRVESFSLRAGGPAIPVSGVVTSGNYFEVLGLVPALGRFYYSDVEALVVLGHAFWRERLGGAPDVVGSLVHVDGQPFRVAGVAPRGFNGTTTALMADLWLPAGAYSVSSGTGYVTWVVPFGRLRPDIGVAHASAAIDGIARRLPAEPNTEVRSARTEPMTGLPADVRPVVAGFLGMLLGTALLVLLIASANIAALLLARGVARRREVAVRLALGAGRRRLLRQLLTENLLLFLLGGAGGMLIMLWATRLIAAVRLPIGEPVVFDATPDLRVFAFGFAVAAVAGLLFGLAPALQASRPDLVGTLKDGAGAGGGRRARGRSVFVVAQLGMSVLLLVVAGLFVRTLQQSLSVEPGFDATGVHVVTLDVRRHGLDEARGTAFFAQLSERVRAIPGIEAAALADLVLLSGSQSTLQLSPADDPDQRASIGRSNVDAEYLSMMRIPLVSGRGFTAADGVGAPRVVVVNETLARRFWPDRNPLGQQLRRGETDYEVIGVVRDGRYQTLGEAQAPHVFFAAQQQYFGLMTLHVRSRLPTAETIERVRAEVHALNPDVALEQAVPLAALMRMTMLPQRVAAYLVGAFGLLGLVLAGLGVYGVVAFQVAQRTRELGIRVALGAGTGHVRGLIVGRGARLAAIGLGLGLAAAAAVTHLLQGLLYGVSALDPITFVGVALLLGGVAVLASYLPAVRATRIDPLHALRQE